MPGLIVVIAFHGWSVELDIEGNKGPWPVKAVEVYQRVEDTTVKVCQRAEVMEATFECLKEVLTKAETDLAKARADSASKKKKREVEAVKTKEKLA